MSRDEQQPPAERPRGPGRRKAMPDAERRAMIIATALETFIERGYSGTTTDNVAARCRISKQTLYAFFPSKTALFVAAVAAHRQMMLDLPRPDEERLPIAETLERIFLLDISDEIERKRSTFIHMVMQEADRFPEIGEVLYREGLMRSLTDLAEWLATQRSLGRLDIDDPLSGARILMDMIFGGRGAPGPKGRDWMTPEIRSHHLRRCIAIFARGTAPQT
ncbi:TetR/AcrR family transcriptional regulator [Metarhizobium album]|uniref:TetR/AcrR family transcriptional regulator n=1 Tax=Metarhizobium album TaxID=2182425 RepID=A0A2U2DU96_9HYPH|nr:TetR/AcrR family transcriptional regulator [Rhizobium album]PWE56876.1 TetR/AcrR family transcriptional regulator [Rhizobium album]